MTDTFVVDEEGAFTIGKAQTTPQRESDGLLRSFDDALHYWDLTREHVTKHLTATVCSEKFPRESGAWPISLRPGPDRRFRGRKSAQDAGFRVT